MSLLNDALQSADIADADNDNLIGAAIYLPGYGDYDDIFGIVIERSPYEKDRLIIDGWIVRRPSAMSRTLKLTFDRASSYDGYIAEGQFYINVNLRAVIIALKTENGD